MYYLGRAFCCIVYIESACSKYHIHLITAGMRGVRPRSSWISSMSSPPTHLMMASRASSPSTIQASCRGVRSRPSTVSSNPPQPIQDSCYSTQWQYGVLFSLYPRQLDSHQPPPPQGVDMPLRSPVGPHGGGGGGSGGEGCGDFHGEDLEGNSKASGGRLLQDKVEGRNTREVRTGHVTTCIQCSQKV